MVSFDLQTGAHLAAAEPPAHAEPQLQQRAPEQRAQRLQWLSDRRGDVAGPRDGGLGGDEREFQGESAIQVGIGDHLGRKKRRCVRSCVLACCMYHYIYICTCYLFLCFYLGMSTIAYEVIVCMMYVYIYIYIIVVQEFKWYTMC